MRLWWELGRGVRKTHEIDFGLRRVTGKPREPSLLLVKWDGNPLRGSSWGSNQVSMAQMLLTNSEAS